MILQFLIWYIVFAFSEPKYDDSYLFIFCVVVLGLSCIACRNLNMMTGQYVTCVCQGPGVPDPVLGVMQYVVFRGTNYNQTNFSVCFAAAIRSCFKCLIAAAIRSCFRCLILM